MLVRMGEILVKARKEGYGIITVSCFNLELIKAAISAAERRCSPVILNINLKYDFIREKQDMELFSYAVRQRAMRSTVPVAINLDHGQDYQTVMRVISHGFTSVMVGASSKPYEENMAVTREVVHVAHSTGLPVEAGLGCIGMTDETFILENKYTKSAETDPVMMKDFVEKTGVDSLAISVGNAHGPYAKNIAPHIDFDLLEEVAVVTPIPLILHDGSGTGDKDLSKVCKMGTSKINVGTDLMGTAVRRASQYYQENPNMGRINFLTNYVSGYQEGIEYCVDIFGSTGKAIPSVAPKTRYSHPES